jgi:transposase
LGDFSKFSSHSEIMKLAGLALYEISSGKRKGQRRISKRGRSLLRKILFYVAIQRIRKNGIMYDYYARLTCRGMGRVRVLIKRGFYSSRFRLYQNSEDEYILPLYTN